MTGALLLCVAVAAAGAPGTVTPATAGSPAAAASPATMAAPGSPPASSAVVRQGSTHLLIITGLSGEARFAAQYREWGSALVEAATTRLGVPAGNVVWLAEREDVHEAVTARSSLDNIQAQLARLAEAATPADRVLILMFGHGTFANGETLFNVPGRNLRGSELASLLEPISGRVAVVNAASSSGGFIQELAAPNRVVITATRTGFERNETLFGGHFVAALTGAGDADVDNDGRVSLLEAFEYARREVEREYQRTNRLKTEHAVIDGVGDGQGVPATTPDSPHALLAAAFHLGLPARAAAASPELRALYAEQERLEGELTALRGRRATMPEAAYEAALEALLVEVALNAQAIRRLEGGR
jgi:hypothetical protein